MKSVLACLGVFTIAPGRFWVEWMLGYLFILLILLSGCGVSPDPCTGIMDDADLVRMAVAVERHREYGVSENRAMAYCNFLTPGWSNEQTSCCRWVVDQVYGGGE